MLASNIIYEHLGVCVDIVNTRRLGQPGNGAVHPLLTHVHKRQGHRIGPLTRQDVRHASDEYIRTKVYINADLTPAEAKAAVYVVNSDLFSATYNVSGNVLITSIQVNQDIINRIRH